MVFSTYEEKWYNEYYAQMLKEYHKQDFRSAYETIVHKPELPTWAIDGVL